MYEFLLLSRGGAVRKLVGLITRRSQVQILPPLLLRCGLRPLASQPMAQIFLEQAQKNFHIVCRCLWQLEACFVDCRQFHDQSPKAPTHEIEAELQFHFVTRCFANTKQRTEKFINPYESKLSTDLKFSGLAFVLAKPSPR